MPSLFYDLHVCESQLEPQTQRERAALALRLGWDGVALVHQAKAAALGDQDRCAIRPTELAALLAASQGVSEALDEARARHAASSRHGSPYTFRQYTRLNFPADDVSTAQASVANTAVISGYDLLVVQPQSERAFALACSSLDVDLISLDLSRRLPYRFKPALVQAALARGLHFEICFSPALREAGARRQLFANAQALCRETRGRGVIVSSCARAAMELRGPHDVMNLAALFGLSQQQAQHAIGKNVEAAVRHAATRRAFRGILTIQFAEEGGDAAEQQAGGEQPSGRGQTASVAQQQQQGQRPKQQQQQQEPKPAGGQQQQPQPQPRGQRQKFGHAAPQPLIGQKRGR